MNNFTKHEQFFVDGRGESLRGEKKFSPLFIFWSGVITVIVECDVQSRVVDCLVEGKSSNQTCCAVSSSLLAHAPRVIAGCEAARTMYPGVSQDSTAR